MCVLTENRTKNPNALQKL